MVAGDELHINYTVKTPWGTYVFKTKITYLENNLIRYQNFGAGNCPKEESV